MKEKNIETNKHRHFKSGICWNKYYLRWAWKKFCEKQRWDEERYTKGILGLNDLKPIFAEKTNKKDWGRRGKDLIYGYWVEEDIRLKLAAELQRYDKWCQIHGQTRISGTGNMRGYYKPVGYNKGFFPDMLLISLKKKERNKNAREPNIESSAIELKYFSMGWNKSDIRESIRKDLSKLIKYQVRRLSPRVESGFFFCIDETGKAKNILDDFFRRPKYKKCPLGYGVCVPKFAKECRAYPRYFEKFEPWTERRWAYLLDYINSKLMGICFNDKPKVKADKNYEHFLYSSLRGHGWMGVCHRKYVQCSKSDCYPVVLHLKNKKPLENYQNLKWLGKKEKYSKTDKKTSVALLCEIKKTRFGSIANIEREGDMIVNMMKRIMKKLS